MPPVQWRQTDDDAAKFLPPRQTQSGTPLAAGPASEPCLQPAVGLAHPSTHLLKLIGGSRSSDPVTLVLSYSSPSRSPNPHHLKYWHVPALSGLLPPFPASPGSGSLSYTVLLRQHGNEGLPPPFELSAPHGARGSRRNRDLHTRDADLTSRTDDVVTSNTGIRQRGRR